MKRPFLVAALILSLASSSAMSGEFWKQHRDSFESTYMGAMAVIVVYATTGTGAAILVGGSTAASITEAELNQRKQSAAKLLLNDSQAYFQTGEMSLKLRDAIEQLKGQRIDLSDLEALDILNESALSILAE